MALMSDVDVPLNVLRAQIASAIDTVVQVSRRSDGSRCVTHVTEVQGYDRENGYRVSHLFESSAEFVRGE
jgi:pilus assembly protein CpaF